tara:strand:+ start:13917 stop:15269 length:1353 start_codon:yes stop_codon:yes gene_type:complete
MENINYNNTKNIIGKRILADGMDIIIDINKSHGSWLVDGRDGREYLDLFSMFASMPIGYNHPHLLKNKDKLLQSAINKPTNSDIYSLEMASFVEIMGRIAQPDYLPHSFFIEGGGLAVENALKAAFDWKARKNLKKGIKNKGKQIIHFRDCFHGRTGYTLSLTDSPDKRKTMFFPKFNWPRVLNPKISFPQDELNIEKVIALEKESVSQIKDVISKNLDDIAAILIEPIQGEGGDNHFRCEFFQNLREIADENEILLIYDEVQTGVGITGKMWAHQHFNKSLCNCDCLDKSSTAPDIIAFGKKTQCCGIFASKRIEEVKENVFNVSSRLNSTWGGSLIDMVRFTLYLEVIEEESLVEKALKSGNHLLTKLLEIEENHNGLISNVRGRGLFCAFDLPTTSERDKLASLIVDNGAIVLGSGTRSIRFRPHLNIQPDEIDYGVRIIEAALKQL